MDDIVSSRRKFLKGAAALATAPVTAPVTAPIVEPIVAPVVTQVAREVVKEVVPKGWLPEAAAMIVAAPSKHTSFLIGASDFLQKEAILMEKDITPEAILGANPSLARSDRLLGLLRNLGRFTGNRSNDEICIGDLTQEAFHKVGSYAAHDWQKLDSGEIDGLLASVETYKKMGFKTVGEIKAFFQDTATKLTHHLLSNPDLLPPLGSHERHDLFSSLAGQGIVPFDAGTTTRLNAAAVDASKAYEHSLKTVAAAQHEKRQRSARREAEERRQKEVAQKRAREKEEEKNGRVIEGAHAEPETRIFHIKPPKRYANLTRVDFHYLSLRLRINGAPDSIKALDAYKIANTVILPERVPGIVSIETSDPYLVGYFSSFRRQRSPKVSFPHRHGQYFSAKRAERLNKKAEPS